MVSLVTSSKRNECLTSGHSRSLPDTFQFISQHQPAIDSASLQATDVPFQILSNSSASIILPSTVPRFRPRMFHSRYFPIHQSASSCYRQCLASDHGYSIPDTFQFISQHHPAIDSASLQAMDAPFQILCNSTVSIILPSTI